MAKTPHTRRQRLIENFVQTIQQQPKPLPLKRPHAAFLEDSVDQRPSSPALKRYCPEAVHSFVTQWVESGSGSESYRERHCRSDTFLGYSDIEPIPRRLTKSAPGMEHKKDAGGYALPQTPYSSGSLRLGTTNGGLGQAHQPPHPISVAPPLVPVGEGLLLRTPFTVIRTWLQIISICAIPTRNSQKILLDLLIMSAGIATHRDRR